MSNRTHPHDDRCRDCGTTYGPWNTWRSGGAHTWRCHSCYLAYTRTRQARTGPRPTRRKQEAILKPFVCRMCSEPFEALHRAGPAPLCGTCKPVRVAARNRAANRDREIRRRARNRSVVRQPYEAEAIFDRDGWRCHLCGKATRRRAKVPHPLAATIDHLIPLSHGGADAPANVATAHFICNSRKGNRVTDRGEQLRLVG